MTRPIFRLERVTNASPVVGTKARQPLAAVNRLVGWIKTEVFTRYELVEQLPAGPTSPSSTTHPAGDASSADGQSSHRSDASPEAPAAARAPQAAQGGQACSRRATPYPQLRVVVVQDERGSRQQHSSRMVISGRMADVCAELDRLAA
jgi:hypothetical protein